MVPITSETVRATYEYLLHFPPFSRWRLPPARKITFSVTDYVSEDAKFDCEKMALRVSGKNVATFDRLIRVVAHEMIHVREHVADQWTIKHDSAFFLRSRKMIFKHFAFDPVDF